MPNAQNGSKYEKPAEPVWSDGLPNLLQPSFGCSIGG
ncbi:uncharacterized protein METZ01_LOCUS431299, partial [marine metagenome]